jgi:5-methyltetrahydrofolate corrinoid/iron sulfur protein methyltransferase
MLLIGENLHIIAKMVSDAINRKDKKGLQQMAKEQAAAGMDYIDLNIGPARKNPEVMGWLVEIVQEVVECPLALDSTNPLAMEAGLKKAKAPPLINSASGKQESKERMLPLAATYGCDVVLSVLTDRGIPSDTEARAESIMESAAYANELGIENERLWIDPILLPVGVSQQGVVACLEFTQMLPDLLPGVKSTIGLSNISNGVPQELRGMLNRTYVVMLQRYGMHSAIVDAFDAELRDLVHGKLPGIVEVIHKAMDGEETDQASFSPEERQYAKTVKVLMGEILYSHTWLEQ